MPELDGFEATLLIRKEEALIGNHIPIIAMTANAMSGDRVRCLASCVDGDLSKPINRQSLEQAIRNYSLAV